jgi:hypothetical protein
MFKKNEKFWHLFLKESLTNYNQKKWPPIFFDRKEKKRKD